jgi:hypothetical protein
MGALRRVASIASILGAILLSLFIAAPTNAHHSIDFDSHSCAEATPAPDDGEPDLTPAPEEPVEGEEPPPAGEEPTPAPKNCMPDEGDRIWGERTIKFSTSTDGTRPLKRVALYILSEDETIPDAQDGQPLLQELYSRDQDVRTYNTPFSWNSNEATPYNGHYKIYVEVDTYPAFTGSETHRATAERGDLRVDNRPDAVSAPKVIATTIGTATIQWEAAPEPDVLTYVVYRATTNSTGTKPAYSAFKQVGLTSGPAYRDSRATPGVHWYSVKVIRRSVVTEDEGISSTLSPISGPAHIKSPEQIAKEQEKDGKAPKRKIPFRDLSPPRVTSRLAAVADAPFKYKLPYDTDASAPTYDAPYEERPEGQDDPRTRMIPVAVGMFLLSSALAVGRMPF